MTINAQGGPGKIRLFNDFFGTPYYYSEDTDSCNLGDFVAGGEGFEDTDAGILQPTSGGLSGVCRLSSANTAADTTFIGTGINFDVGLMAPIVIEARVQFVDLDEKLAFIGLTSILTYDEQLEDIIDYSAGTTVTLTAELAGFLFGSEFTDDEDWHMVYNGGTTTGETDTTEIDADADATAGEWQVLRLEVDPNGTARWYIDGVLKQTVEGAVSTSTDFAVCCGVSATTTEAAVMDVDYLLVEANRDWNA
jgi:hypothetical protein